jgi:hypothetical protein
MLPAIYAWLAKAAPVITPRVDLYSKVERSFNSDRTVAAKRFPESSKRDLTISDFADDWMMSRIAG